MTKLKNPSQFIGFQGASISTNVVLLGNHGLHIVIYFDPNHFLGKTDTAGISDIILESALTTIMDCENSVAAVDVDEKVKTYRNWLGLLKGDLSANLSKDDKVITRTLDDRDFISPDGGVMAVKGRALMLVRNVGHLMTNPAILDRNGAEIFEGLMDAVVTTLIAMHDLQREGGNSVNGSVYVVKPKMHGPEEVGFADETFTMIEKILGLPRNTVKIGIMDEDRAG